MARELIQKMIDRWMIDDNFRKELRKDPEGTIRKNKIQLTDEEWKLFRGVDWGLSDEELKNRATKAFA